MRNLILLLWIKEDLPDWAVEASNSMREYAAKCGAEYRLLHGTPFFDLLPERPSGKPQNFRESVQKLVFLSEEFDEYDQVCMYDMDTCPTPWAKNVFDDPGSLSIWPVSDPSMVNSYRYPWMLTGAIYKFNLEQRRALRNVLWKLDLNAPGTLSGSEASDSMKTWGDECVLAILLHHPDCTLDPASIVKIDVRFEALVGAVPSSGRVWRPSRDEEVSVRHFMGMKKHLIIPSLHKWKGKKGLKSKLIALPHWWRYAKFFLLDYFVIRRVWGALVLVRRSSLAFSSLPLENRVDAY